MGAFSGYQSFNCSLLTVDCSLFAVDCSLLADHNQPSTVNCQLLTDPSTEFILSEVEGLRVPQMTTDN
jgi:hypothetical protein